MTTTTSTVTTTTTTTTTPKKKMEPAAIISRILLSFVMLSTTVAAATVAAAAAAGAAAATAAAGAEGGRGGEASGGGGGDATRRVMRRRPAAADVFDDETMSCLEGRSRCHADATCRALLSAATDVCDATGEYARPRRLAATAATVAELSPFCQCLVLSIDSNVNSGTDRRIPHPCRRAARVLLRLEEFDFSVGDARAIKSKDFFFEVRKRMEKTATHISTDLILLLRM